MDLTFKVTFRSESSLFSTVRFDLAQQPSSPASLAVTAAACANSKKDTTLALLGLILTSTTVLSGTKN